MTAGLRAPTAAILVTGTEILLGRTQDRNSGFLARDLAGRGVRVVRFLAVDDGEKAIASGLRALLDLDVDLIVTSGGLGPTHDDRTMACVAAVAGIDLVLDADVLASIDRRTTASAMSRGLDPAMYAEGNRKQAHVPAGGVVLAPVGTAPGAIVPIGRRRIVVLPGPPVELGRMWEAAVADPSLGPLLAGNRGTQHVLRVFGLPESFIGDVFARSGGDDDGTETTICASRMEIEILVRVPAGAEVAGERLLRGLRDGLGPAVYSEGPARLEEIVLEAARTRGWTLATAESCTAGLVASRIVSVPGSSDAFRGSVVAYANDVKHGLLGVSTRTLESAGAVSPECAREMALGARRCLQADIGVSVTGVAGPGGGTPSKPVGLVYLCAVGPCGEMADELRFPGPRENIREWAATAALHLVRRLLQTG